jgi:hypothetical protein
MRRSHLILGLAGLAGALALTGLVAAQGTIEPAATPEAAPAAGTAPTVVTVPVAPAAKALSNAVTPEEGPPPPKAETTATPALSADDQPPADQPPPEPLKRPRYAAAVMQAVDKLTAETLRFETKIGEPVRFKGIVLTVRACETTAADETAPDNIAFIDVQSQPLNSEVPPRQVYRGWMFASSPSLHPFEHPIYDLWLIACKTTAPVAEPVSAPNTPAVPDKAAAKRAR